MEALTCIYMYLTVAPMYMYVSLSCSQIILQKTIQCMLCVCRICCVVLCVHVCVRSMCVCVCVCACVCVLGCAVISCEGLCVF